MGFDRLFTKDGNKNAQKNVRKAQSYVQGVRVAGLAVVANSAVAAKAAMAKSAWSEVEICVKNCFVVFDSSTKSSSKFM